MTKFGELITGRLHTAYAEVADAVFSLGYFDDTEHRKQVGKAVGHALTVFEDELRQRGLYDIEVSDEHATTVVAKAAGRVIDGLETRLGRRFSDGEVQVLVKAIVNRNRFDRAGEVDLWGSGGRTGTEPLDTVGQGRHPQVSPMDYNGGDDGHPEYEYSRPLEDEGKLRRIVGKATLGMDDEQATGQDDPTSFADGPGPADVSEGMTSEDTGSPTAEPRRVAKEELDRPVTLEVSDQFDDAPAVEAEVESRQRPEPRLTTDHRGAQESPLNLRVGAQDAVALAQLHRSMFRRTIQDRRFDLAVVERTEDGQTRLVEESLE